MEPVLWPLSHSLFTRGATFSSSPRVLPLDSPLPFLLDLICPQLLRANGTTVDICAIFSPDILGVLKPLALTFLFPSHLGYMFSLIPTGKPETGPSNQLLERCWLNFSAISVILYYDYVLTFSDEVVFFWPHENRVGWIASLYFLNRYVALLGYVPIVLRLLPGSSSLFRVRVSLIVLTILCWQSATSIETMAVRVWV